MTTTLDCHAHTLALLQIHVHHISRQSDLQLTNAEALEFVVWTWIVTDGGERRVWKEFHGGVIVSPAARTAARRWSTRN